VKTKRMLNKLWTFKSFIVDKFKILKYKKIGERLIIYMINSLLIKSARH
jgi:hypothetical protein